MPKFSIVVGYRNRDIALVKRFLNSLNNQKKNNFELIFVNYGSNEETTLAITELLSDYSFAKYVYTETRGFLWNRAHALNTGIRFAKGEFIITADSDLIFGPLFTTEAEKKTVNSKYFNYRCIYLPKDHSYNTLSYKLSEYRNYVVSDDTGLGLSVFPFAYFMKYGGYDEFYKIWGFEDLSLSRKYSGERKATDWMNAGDDSLVLHQWHPQVSSDLPDGWFSEMKHHYESKQVETPQKEKQGVIFSSDKRPAIAIHNKYMEDESQFKKINSSLKSDLRNLFEWTLRESGILLIRTVPENNAFKKIPVLNRFIRKSTPAETEILKKVNELFLNGKIDYFNEKKKEYSYWTIVRKDAND